MNHLRGMLNAEAYIQSFLDAANILTLKTKTSEKTHTIYMITTTTRKHLRGKAIRLMPTKTCQYDMGMR